MKIPKKIFDDLRVYDSVELEKLIHAVADELNGRSYYKDSEIAFIYERDV
jgi:hypothetical protein